ncbi:hypothetical protein KY361_04125 [Candidatus Woesearchaeota archaeon]|nr:hypothetical protein [Candidatus Woesearchaeota archaeon]
MQKENSFEDEVEKFKREIALLKWDIPNLRNSELKSAKEQELRKHEEELQRLLANKKLEVVSNG